MNDETMINLQMTEIRARMAGRLQTLSREIHEQAERLRSPGETLPEYATINGMRLSIVEDLLDAQSGVEAAVAPIMAQMRETAARIARDVVVALATGGK